VYEIISNEFRLALLKSPVVRRPATQQATQNGIQTAQQASALRISDTLAGRVVLNQGEKSGIRRGAEYGPANGDRGLVKLAAVYPEFAEGHIVFGREVLTVGTLMERRGKGRLQNAQVTLDNVLETDRLARIYAAETFDQLG
ncbi:MAG: hypothetical protein R6T97_00075, partial [Yoonia sp.]